MIIYARSYCIAYMLISASLSDQVMINFSYEEVGVVDITTLFRRLSLV
jgi:hypothetical protein